MPNPWATLRRATRDRSSGAAEIAERAAEAIAELQPSDADRALRELVMGHPSMAPLWNLAVEVVAGPDPASGAARFLRLVADDAEAAALMGRSLPPWVLTISRSSSVLRALRGARLRMVSCMRSEPGAEGERMAEEIAAFARSRVVDDDEALRLVPAAAVVIGADSLGPGGLVNKVKSRGLAEAADARGVPIYAVAGRSKFLSVDLPVETGFERVPLRLITGVATGDGLLTWQEAEAAARGRPFPDALVSLLDDARVAAGPP